jgi:predicted nucleic acid-binding Zn ribbon protein
MRRLGEALSGALRTMGLDEGLRGWDAVSEWAEAVGPQIARRARARRFHDGILWVEVDGSVWLHQLTMLKRDLLRRIHERLGAGSVRDLKFINSRGGTQR